MKTDWRPDDPIVSVPVHREAAPLVELDRLRRHIRRQPLAALLSRELLREREQHPAMPQPLNIRTNRNPAEDCDCRIDVDSHDADRLAAIEQELRIVAERALVGTIFLVDAKLSACLEQHCPADLVIGAPLGPISRRDQLVIIHREEAQAPTLLRNQAGHF